MKKETKYVGLAILGLILGIICFFISIWFRGEQDSDTGADASPPPPVATEVTAEPKAERDNERDSIPTAIQSAKRGSTVESRAILQSPSDPEYDFVSEAFSAEDINKKDMNVEINLGDYRAVAGEEFEVNVRMHAPALESMTLLMEYDPEVIEYVANSAKAVGKAFRRGIEFYADNQKGRMVLLNSGIPGAKNMNVCDGGSIASFRVLAKAPGETQLQFPEMGMTFINGRGEEIDQYDIRGGSVVVDE